MEPNNILANDVTVSGPAAFLFFARYEWIARLCSVVHQSIEPYVDRLRLVIWHTDTPLESVKGARDGQIFETRLHRLNDLLVTVLWNDPVRISFVELKQWAAECGETEVIVFF